jgi:hypothetical protein
MTGRWHHLILGTILGLGLVLAIAALSAWPNWQSLPEDHALVRLSFTVSGARNCRDRTPEELAALPPNMRQAQICERRRAPVLVELDLDGATVLSRELPPTGLSGSGPSRIYRRFELPAGSYEIALRLRTDPAEAGFTANTTRNVALAPGQSLAIDYDTGVGDFVFD